MAKIPRTARKYAASSRIHNACLPRPPAAPGSGRIGVALLFMAALFLTPLFAHADVIYVDTSAAGANTGSSWSDAYTDLQDALAGAVSGDEIWVAAGLYKPTDGTDRTATFQLKNGVEIYGGFAGTETQRDQRAPGANVTVLSGDIDGNDTTDGNGVVVNATDITGSNSYHVVTGSGVDGTAVLDGLTITGGNADGPALSNTDIGGGMFNKIGSPTLANLVLSGNSAGLDGGGMVNYGSSPVLTNVTFSGNSAGHGGGMENSFSSNPVLINVVFSGNSASQNGGGMENFNVSNPVLTNVTFSGNSAGSSGGGMLNYASSTPDIRNTIFWNNKDSTGTGTAAASIFNDSSTPTISYSLVQGCNSGGTWDGDCGTDSGNNLTDADPLFVNTPDPNAAPTTAGNLRLQVGSPAIDAGNEAFIDDIANATDLDGNPRRIGDAVDLGPHEFPDFLLEIGVDGKGAVSTDPEQVSYMHGTQVELTATGDPGWTFSNWSGDLTGTANPATLTMDNNKMVTASFSKDPPVADAGMNQTVAIGSLVTLDGSGSYDEDPDQTLTYLWDQTQGEAVDLSDSTAVQPTFTAPSQPDVLTFTILVSNEFDKSDTHAVSITVRSELEVSASVSSGAGSISPASQTVEAGADASFTIAPDDGWVTAAVTGDTCNPTQSDETVWVAENITANCSVTADFEAIGLFHDRFEGID